MFINHWRASSFCFSLTCAILIMMLKRFTATNESMQPPLQKILAQ
jgi:hypothetical protein